MVESNKPYTIEINVDCPDFNGPCQVSVIRAYDWYDIGPIVIDAACTVENGLFRAELLNELERGLYLVSTITINDIGFSLGKLDEGFIILTAFYAGAESDISPQVLHDSYYEVLNHREEVFNEVKGDLKNGNTKFDCYVFVKNMNAATRIQYGDIEVIPFNRYKTLSASKMIDAYFQSKGLPFDYSSDLKDGFGAVIYMKNIMSDEEGETAKKLINGRAEILANLFSLSNHDNCQILSTVIHNLKTDMYYIRIPDPIYQGNLLRLADQGFAMRELYTYLAENDTNLNVYVKLFNEAEAETDIMACLM